MKLATFKAEEGARVGIVDPEGGRLFDLTKASRSNGSHADTFASMLALIDAGDVGLDDARKLYERFGDDQAFSRPISGTELLAPLPEPRQMRDGMTFATHIRQARAGRGRALAAARAAGDEAEVAQIMARELPELPEIYKQIPIYYFTNRLAVTGPEVTVTWPRYSRIMDYELELGIITGRKGKNIKSHEARDFIFGYTIFNDFSARDQQRLESEGRLGPAKGKSFENSNAIGPWIVTKDEIPDPYNLKMTARINGQTVCENTSAGMLFNFEQILAHVSQDEWIWPGEFFGSGTVGDGCGLENGYFLSDGDTIELEIANIGILRNKVAAPRTR